MKKLKKKQLKVSVGVGIFSNVVSILDAKKVCEHLRDGKAMDATQYYYKNIGKVYHGKKYVGHVSYDGKIWQGKGTRKEIFA